MADEIKDVAPDVDEPLEVIVREKKKESRPDFNYDDYSPDEIEILTTEDEIEETTKKRTTDGS